MSHIIHQLPDVAPAADSPNNEIISPVSINPKALSIVSSLSIKTTAVTTTPIDGFTTAANIALQPLKLGNPSRRKTTELDSASPIQNNTVETLELLSRKISNVNISNDMNRSNFFNGIVQNDVEYNENTLRIALGHEDVTYNLSAIKFIRRYLCEDDVKARTDTILSLNILPFINRFLHAENINAELQYEACWCITNMAAGTTQQTGHLVSQGVHESLFSLFNSRDVLVSTQAIWAMGNICGDCQEYRDEVLKLPDFINNLLHACTGYFEDPVKKHQILKISVWTIANLCRWRHDWKMLDNAYPFLESMLIHSTNDLELLSEICWALCRMFHIRSAQAGTPISSRFIQELVKLLDGVDRVEITTPVLRTITNIVACEDDVFIQKFIDAHIIPRLYSLVSQHNHFTSQLEAILVMANMTAGQTSQVQSVLDSNIFPVLINIVNSDPYSTSASSINADRLKRESIWVLGNATTYRQFDQLNTMMDMGVLDTLIRFLATNLVVKDPNTSWKAIQSILNFIEGGDLASSPSGYTPALASSSNAFVCHIRSQEWMLHTFAENIGCIDLALNTGLPLEGGRFTVTINNNGTSDSFMLTSKQLSNFKKARDALNLILTKWFTVWWNARMNGGSNGGLDDLVNSLENVQLD